MALSNELRTMHRVVGLLEKLETSDGLAARIRGEEYVAAVIAARRQKDAGT